MKNVKKNEAATKALRWGVGAAVCWFVAPVALYKGLCAKREIDAAPDQYSNRSSASAAIALGGLGSALLVTSAIVGVVAERDVERPTIPSSQPSSEPAENSSVRSSSEIRFWRKFP